MTKKLLVPLDLGGQKATNAADPTADTDLASQGWVKSNGLFVPSTPPTGAIAETFDRMIPMSDSATTLPSGTLRMVRIWLPKGKVVTSETFVSGATALAAGTHLWCSLFDGSRVLLRQSTDDTAPAWAANTAKTLNLSTPFTTTYAGLHYLGLCCVATTRPSLLVASHGSTTAIALAPILNGLADSGLTTTAPGTAAAITATAAVLYGYVS